jgi:hypothetical protein
MDATPVRKRKPPCGKGRGAFTRTLRGKTDLQSKKGGCEIAKFPWNVSKSLGGIRTGFLQLYPSDNLVHPALRSGNLPLSFGEQEKSGPVVYGT